MQRSVPSSKRRAGELVGECCERGGAFWLGREDADATALPRLAMLRSGHVMHGDDWLSLRKREAYNVTGVRLFPLFTGLLALGLLLGALAATWYREGH